jgi:hypothetical protein
MPIILNLTISIYITHPCNVPIHSSSQSLLAAGSLMSPSRSERHQHLVSRHLSIPNFHQAPPSKSCDFESTLRNYQLPVLAVSLLAMAAPAHAAARLLSPLETLPLPVLDSICEHLAMGDSKRRSIFAFSMASRLCCAIADKQRFKQISFLITDSQELEEALAQWDKIVRIGKRTSYVRSVRIAGRIKPDGEDEHQTGYANSLIRQYGGLEDENCHVGEDGISRPRSLFWFDGGEPTCTTESKATSNRLWQPLADFLPCLFILKHLIWAATDQIPRCILDVLHSQLPGTLLHVNTFSLRSFYQWSDQTHDIDVDEYALVTSPSLSSICVVTCYLNHDGRMDYNHEAARDMVLWLAPNLRSLYMSYQITGDTPGLRNAIRSPRPPWEGFTSAKAVLSPKSKRCLDAFALQGDRFLFLERFHDWTQRVDFSTLKSLDITLPFDLPIMKELSSMAEAGAFKCLRDLSLSALHEEVHAITFLSSLRPLESLYIKSKLSDAIVSSILAHHGTSLEKLLLPGCPSDRYIENMCKGFINLRELELSFKRTRGDQQEVSLYQSLGSFPKLERLTILLNCDGPESSDLDGDMAIVAQHMGSALLNCAIDADLARSIFLTMLAANRAVRPQQALSIRYLKLDCTLGSFGEFGTMQNLVARGWVCERERLDVPIEDFTVRETKVHEKEITKQYIISEFEEDYRPGWEAAWPRSKGKSNWLDEWHSLPLYSGSS